jgi:hypothetical protein
MTSNASALVLFRMPMGLLHRLGERTRKLHVSRDAILTAAVSQYLVDREVPARPPGRATHLTTPPRRFNSPTPQWDEPLYVQARAHHERHGHVVAISFTEFSHEVSCTECPWVKGHSV